MGTALYNARLTLWSQVVRCAAAWVPDDEHIDILIDDFTKKKAGDHIDGLDRYRNGAGSARQEYRTLWGVHFVIGEMLIRLRPWPDAFISVPIG